MAQYDVDLRDYWRILKKRKFTIIFMVIAVGMTSYGAARLKEPVPLYEATSSVKIERGASMMGGGLEGEHFSGEAAKASSPRHLLSEVFQSWYTQPK